MEYLRKYYKVALIAGVLTFIYFKMFQWMVYRWNAHDSYFGHGFLVPLVSLYLVWRQRKELMSIPTRPSNWGLALIIGGALIHILSAFFRIYFTSAYSLVIVITGLVWYFFGGRIVKAVMFPLSFLLFMVPLPLVAIVNITFKMKMFAAERATAILNRIGMQAVLQGSLIRMRKAELMVEDPCSGLRSLIALLALGALVAYFSKLSRVKKVIVFCLSGVIALIANIARIVMMSALSELYGVQFIEGPMHTASGLFVFVIAFAGLAFLVSALEQ